MSWVKDTAGTPPMYFNLDDVWRISVAGSSPGPWWIQFDRKESGTFNVGSFATSSDAYSAVDRLLSGVAEAS